MIYKLVGIVLQISFIILFQISLKISSLCSIYVASSITIPYLQFTSYLNYLMLVEPLKAATHFTFINVFTVCPESWMVKYLHTLSSSHSTPFTLFYIYIFHYIYTHYSQLFPTYSPLLPKISIFYQYSKNYSHIIPKADNIFSM